MVTRLAGKWFFTLKPWLAPTLMLVAVLAIGGAWVTGYQTGKKAERTAQELRHAQVLEGARMAQEALADELEAAKAERQIVYRDRIRYVDRVADPTGCLDVDVLDDRMYESLRRDRDG